MQLQLTVVDQLFSVPQAVRKVGLECDFAVRPHGGIPYPGVGIPEGKDHQELYQRLYDRMETAIGFKIKPTMAFFRLHLEGDDDKQVGWVHADNGEAEFAAVYYLTLPEHCRGGTSFWFHKTTGHERVSRQPSSFRNHYIKTLRDDSSYEFAWTHKYTIPMKWNRLLIYPTDLFHSRWPKECWGKTKEEGRLIWACFFNRA